MSAADTVVSLYITALGYAVYGHLPDAYERLKAAGYLRDDADRQSVTALIKTALSERFDSIGDEYWWHIQDHLVRGQVLSPSGLAAAKRHVTRRGDPIE